MTLFPPGEGLLLLLVGGWWPYWPQITSINDSDGSNLKGGRPCRGSSGSGPLFLPDHSSGQEGWVDGQTDRWVGGWREGGTGVWGVT